MIDPDQRQAGRQTQPLGQHDPRQHATDQTGTCRDSNAVQIPKGDTGCRQGAFDTVVKPFRMGARRDFRHNSAEAGMEFILTLDLGRQNDSTGLRSGTDDGCGGVVAAAFNAQKRRTVEFHPRLPLTPIAGNTNPMPAQSRAPVILLTRPAEQAARFQQALQGRVPDVAVVVSPLLAPVLTTPTLPNRDWGAIIFTSQTAVSAARTIQAQGQALPRQAFCVGDQTARMASDAGFVTVTASGDANALFELVRVSAPMGPLLHLCGRDRAGDVARRLSQAGRETVSVIAYSQEEQPLTDDAAALLHGGARVVAPVFSPRSAAILARECARIGRTAPLTVVAISAEAGRGIAPDQLIIAARPDVPAMLDAISSLFNANPTP